MASPTAHSPPLSTKPLPKKRPALSATHQSKRRKPSTAGPSGLRQTSFPPENPLLVASGAAGSPSLRGTTRSPSIDSSVLPGASSIRSGAGGRKRKRGGEPARSTTGLTAVNAAAGSLINGAADEDGEAEDDDDVDEQQLQTAGSSEAARKQERENLAMLIEAFTPDQAERYDMFRRVKLRKDQVRRVSQLWL
jgi:transcription initiation factor TFIID subunit 11